MWIKRDFEHFLESLDPSEVAPIKVLKGPRQVGKTSLLEHSGRYKLVLLDDLNTRQMANENPRLFLDQFENKPLLLDEATLAPELFPELKRRVDDIKRKKRQGKGADNLDIWLTGSNQTLLEKSVQESLAGRASYFDLNTLSIHELNKFDLSELLIKGGWPELYVDTKLSPPRFLNDLISTFIEKDIVSAAGIERKAAFSKTIGLLAGRIGQLANSSDIAKNVGVETTTVQSWVAKLEQNAIVRIIQPFFSNLNQRLIKSPKIYFEDVGLASRFQGWTTFDPLFVSPAFGSLLENLLLTEVVRFFQNRGLNPKIFFIRSKEKVEVDFLIELSDNRWVAVEVKASPSDFTLRQVELLDSTKLNVIERWCASPVENTLSFSRCRHIHFSQVFGELGKLSK